VDKVKPPAAPTKTHCPYCSLQCGISVTAGDRPATLLPQEDWPTNKGGLCSKGWTATALLDHPERLLRPLVRAIPGDRRSPLVETSWDEAFSRIVDAIGDAQADHGRDAVGIFGGGGPDQRKDLCTREVRPGRAAHGVDRLQRPLLYVVGCHGCQSRLWHRSRAALSARGHRRLGARHPGGQQSRRDDATGHAVLRRGPFRRCSSHRRRSAGHAHRPGQRAAPTDHARHRPRARQRTAPPCHPWWAH